MGTSMGSSMETSTGEQETGSVPQFFKSAPVVALRGETVQPRDTAAQGLRSEDLIQPHHQTHVESHTHLESHQDVVSQPQRDVDPRDLRSEVLQPISPALRSRDLVRDRRDVRPELVRPTSPTLRSPALSCPVPRPPTTVTSSLLTTAGCNEGNFMKTSSAKLLFGIG